MQHPGPGQPEEDQDADDPTLIRVPRPDEDPAGDPQEETGDRGDRGGGEGEDPAGETDPD